MTDKHSNGSTPGHGPDRVRTGERSTKTGYADVLKEQYRLLDLEVEAALKKARASELLFGGK